jgi:CDP-6-deoxy-D-xylo-4-hexulose-3-dehydrase
MVNSGSSANLLLLGALRELHGTAGVICQAVTWATNISPVLQYGFDLHLVDVSLRNFGPNPAELDSLLARTGARVVFLTHLLGFPAATREILDICRRHGAILLEDCCESHGASLDGVRVGTFGEGSSFSFYYGHHMTTIEGGMISTHREDLYHRLLLLRSHGLSRELPKPEPEPGVDPRFTFLLHGYNVRPTELNAFLGLRQLPRLDGSIEIRNRNLRTWIGALDPQVFHTNFDLTGVSSFSLPLLLSASSPRSLADARQVLDECGVESRPVVSGNIARQPFLRGHPVAAADLPNAEFIHQRGMYLGNYPLLSEEQIKTVACALNKALRV